MRNAIPLFIGVLLIFGCATPRPVPPPRVAVVPPPRALVTPTPQPAGADWRDWPLTPGDWRYRGSSDRSLAVYGSSSELGALSLQCVPATHQVTIQVVGYAAGPVTVRTTSLTRALMLQVTNGDSPSPGALATLSATDPLLDAIAFSRGRFVVAAPGRPAMVVPVYAEIGRVIEDCRG